MKFLRRFLLVLALLADTSSAARLAVAGGSAVALVASSSTAHATCNVHAGDLALAWGDSITLGTGWTQGGWPWLNSPGGYVAQVQAAFPVPAPRAYRATATGGRSFVVGSLRSTVAASTLAPSVTFISKGGAGVTAVAADATFHEVANMIAAAPVGTTSPVILNEWAVNDAAAIAASTETENQFKTAVTNIVTAEKAQWPAARILWLNALAHGELHTQSPPAWGPGNDIDTQIALVNSDIATLAGSVGFITVDNRAALLVREVLNNPGNAASGVETVDGTHPMIEAMTNAMAPTALAACPPQ